MPIKQIYLPNEGLQGEDIPSHITWDSLPVTSIQIKLPAPLKVKNVFNSKNWKMSDGQLSIEQVEWDGYIGLVFETSKVSNCEVLIEVEYVINTKSGGSHTEKRFLTLFKPKLVVTSKKSILINPKTNYVKNRIKIQNVGRGTLFLAIKSTEESQAKVETPKNYQEFFDKYYSDLRTEIDLLVVQYPELKPVMDEALKWETRSFVELSEEEREEALSSAKKVAEVIANNEKFRTGFLSAVAKSYLKNTELIESIGRFVELLKSFVSYNLILVNPFDEINFENEINLKLKISQTDNLFDEYEDVVIPQLTLKCEGAACSIPVHNLFEWIKK